MRFEIVKAIYKKELLDLVRDRRTLISMIAVPVLVFPLLMVVGSRVVRSMDQKSKDEAKTMTVAVHAADPEIAAAVRKAGLLVTEEAGDVRSRVESKKSIAAVEEIPGPVPMLQVYADEANPPSRGTADTIRAALGELKAERVRRSLRSSGIAESVLTPFQVKRVNVAPPRKMAGMVWGTMLGYLLLLTMFTGGMYPVIDMTAGEKERKTLETFLASPAGRDEIVLGKILAAMTAIAITAALTLTSVVASVRNMRAGAGNEEMKAMLNTMPLDSNTMGLIALTLIPLIVFSASAMMAIAIHARSFKEGSSYLQPLMLAVIFPALLGGMPGMELTPAMCLIPIFNASQLIRAIMLGEFSMSAFGITFAANMVYAAIAFVIARRRFEDEGVLFRT